MGETEILERRSLTANKKKKIWEKLGISSDEEFEKYLRQEYETKSISQIAQELGFNKQKSLKRYFDKYNIILRGAGEYFAEDLTEQIINGIEFLEPTNERSNGKIKWKCKCHCGNIWIVSCDHIKRKEIQSCGKCKKQKNKISEEQKNKIIEFRKDNPNISSYEIGKILNISSRTIRHILKKEGLNNLTNQPGNKHQSWKGCGVVPRNFWSNFKLGAERRHIPYLISLQEIDELYNEQGGVCALSEEKLTFGGYRKTKEWNASLDRIDSSGPYSKENCQLVTKDINKAKQQLSDEEFIIMCQQVTKVAAKKK